MFRAERNQRLGIARKTRVQEVLPVLGLTPLKQVGKIVMLSGHSSTSGMVAVDSVDDPGLHRHGAQPFKTGALLQLR